MSSIFRLFWVPEKTQPKGGLEANPSDELPADIPINLQSRPSQRPNTSPQPETVKPTRQKARQAGTTQRKGSTINSVRPTSTSANVEKKVAEAADRVNTKPTAKKRDDSSVLNDAANAEVQPASELEFNAMKALTDFLSRKDYPIMLVLNPHLLAPFLRQRLAALNKSFAGTKRKSEASESELPPTKKTKTAEQQDVELPTDPRQGPMKRLITRERLRLPRVFTDHLEANGTDGMAFMEVEIALVHHAHRLGKDEGLCEALAASYHFIASLNERSEMDRVRRCFTMIMFSDFMELLHPRAPKIEAVARTRRVGHLMHERAVKLLDTTFASQPDLLVEAKENMTKWCRWGDKLKVLCDKFGEGAVFYLEASLSDDFLENKFHLDGQQARLAFDNLTRLQLREKGVKTQMTELGVNIRRFMIEPLKSRITHEAADEEDSAESDGGIGLDGDEIDDGVEEEE